MLDVLRRSASPAGRAGPGAGDRDAAVVARRAHTRSPWRARRPAYPTPCAARCGTCQHSGAEVAVVSISLNSVGTPARAGRQRRWPLYVAVAVGFGLYQGLNQRIEHSTVAPWKPFLWELSSILMIAALVPLIVRFEARFRLDARPRRSVWLAHAAGALGFSVLHVTGMVLLRKLVYALAGSSYEFGNLFVSGFYELQKDLITYLLVLLIIFAVREFRVRRAEEVRAAELAAGLSEAQLRHLTAQIEPHFLFNTLNAISNRMHEDVAAADRMISQLADLLRAAYETDRSLLVPLARELDWLSGYAAMMRERFRGQLEVDIQVEGGLEALQVPRLLLQPLAENAIRHGLAGGSGRLEIDIRRTGSELRYTVADDGAGLAAGAVKYGTGLSNVARRLQLLFPDAHVLELAPRRPRGAVVTVSFPVRA